MSVIVDIKHNQHDCVKFGEFIVKFNVISIEKMFFFIIKKKKLTLLLKKKLKNETNGNKMRVEIC